MTATNATKSLNLSLYIGMIKTAVTVDADAKVTITITPFYHSRQETVIVSLTTARTIVVERVVAMGYHGNLNDNIEPPTI